MVYVGKFVFSVTDNRNNVVAFFRINDMSRKLVEEVWRIIFQEGK